MATEPAKPDRAGGKPPSVYIAEDDDAMRDLLAMEFREDGWEVEEEASGARVLERLRKAPDGAGTAGEPDLILADLHLGMESGLRLLETIRRSNPSLPFILMTGFGVSEIREQARGLGASALFEKPFDLGDLLRAARRLVSAARPPD
jgi:CheY-like chemotaxis protein